MLERLDAIDWSQVGSCYGNSEEIPVAIRGLTSEDADVRGKALHTLWHSLEHQGSVFEASALAVPFLLSVLADPQTQGKRELVQFLAHLGCRGRFLDYSYEWLEMRIILQKTEEDEMRIPQEKRDIWRKWREDTHQRFREGIPLFLSLLSDPDPQIREEVAFLLATFSEDRPRLLPSLVAQLKVEQHEAALCSLLLCLSYLLEPTPDASQLLLRYLEKGETKLIQFTAARALCTLLGERTPEKAVYVLLDVFRHPYPLQPSHERLSSVWGSGWIHARSLYYLDILTASPYQTLIMERLIELFPTLDIRVDSDCADLLVRVAFYEKGFYCQPDTTFDDLDPMQQAVLRTLVAHEAFWAGYDLQDDFYHKTFHYSPKVGGLRCVGLPTTRQELQALIATVTQQ